MFYCRTCGNTNEWPESFSKSIGTCEICGGNNVVCYDVPSKHLPIPKHIEREKIIDELLDDI
tara:strand:- start:877 stop:1062 length:186 start_codon:yes stop_codon:yes gene_type:complete